MTTAQLSATRLNLNEARCEALFASGLQPSDATTSRFFREEPSMLLTFDSASDLARALRRAAASPAALNKTAECVPEDDNGSAERSPDQVSKSVGVHQMPIGLSPSIAPLLANCRNLV